MAPRSAEQNEAVRAETRGRIMDAALTLFSRHGFDGTSVRMIAEECGVAQGLMYAHFESKDALLQALFRTSMEDVQASFSVGGVEKNPRARLRAYILGIGPMIRKHQQFWRLSYGVRMQPAVLKALGPGLHDWTRVVLRTLESFLDEAGVKDADVEARVLFAVIDGICQHFVIDPRRYPLDEVLERVAARFVPKETRKP